MRNNTHGVALNQVQTSQHRPELPDPNHPQTFIQYGCIIRRLIRRETSFVLICALKAPYSFISGQYTVGKLSQSIPFYSIFSQYCPNVEDGLSVK